MSKPIVDYIADFSKLSGDSRTILMKHYKEELRKLGFNSRPDNSSDNFDIKIETRNVHFYCSRLSGVGHIDPRIKVVDMSINGESLIAQVKNQIENNFKTIALNFTDLQIKIGNELTDIIKAYVASKLKAIGLDTPCSFDVFSTAAARIYPFIYLSAKNKTVLHYDKAPSTGNVRVFNAEREISSFLNEAHEIFKL